MMAATEIPPAPDATTEHLPVVGARDRRRAAALLLRPAPGRYLAIEDAGELVLLPLRNGMRIGRDSAADVVLDSASVSRRHALVIDREGGTVLLDDRSRNGVRVNGRRVSAAVLRDGDQIRLGAVAMRYVEIPTNHFAAAAAG